MNIWDHISADKDTGAERLVSEYGDRLFTAAYRIVKNEAEAEDLVFRTFERVLTKIDMYDGRSRFFSWLYSVMLNFRRMDLRRRGANALVFEDEVPDAEDPALDPSERLAVKQDAQTIRDAVASLGEDLRTVVVLRYFEDFDLLTISRTLEVPIGTVKFRLHSARKRLAEILRQTFPGETASNLKETKR